MKISYDKSNGTLEKLKKLSKSVEVPTKDPQQDENHRISLLEEEILSLQKQISKLEEKINKVQKTLSK